MSEEFNLEQYLGKGIETIVKGALNASLKNPKESIFITRFSLSVKESRKKREKHEKSGNHIPPFLIASITEACNLNCKGCYANVNKTKWQDNTISNQTCNNANRKQSDQMSAKEWGYIFEQADELGISFILLAGGEPLIRLEIIEVATRHKNIMFPIFTNGTLINESYLKLFDKNRNLIPILSIEGNEDKTDLRRGDGVYNQLISVMEQMKDKGIFYGASITVTKENIKEVTDQSFLSELYHRGCKVIFYVEYVPIDNKSKDLAPTDNEREYMEEKLKVLRNEYEDMIFISFPGDEKSSGGCLAAGRGFFHINPSGGTEPCPFSPYSDTNLKETSLFDALKSPLFKKLSDNHILMQEHTGGCVLFEQEEVVRRLLNS
ncbi:radical SAM protein [Mobilitalea sibirica]|uniref:Radical SAM protein n=1 Tax=Mobilitalea sibirica TaxID=1462919 RepID=A0A8J7KTU8_9FIRM|nr:radical SAM protein [Mobilitalea sibirica]MBH1941766.1 radical SAM protein [Mobilitalea sibirica]